MSGTLSFSKDSQFNDNELTVAKPTCRVENKLNWIRQPGGSAWEANPMSYKFSGTTYYDHGILRLDQNPNNLRPYQMRSYVVPDFFNSGCTPLYCQGSEHIYPTGQSACNGMNRTSSWNNKALDPFFASRDPYISNSVPSSAVCAKGVTGNSTAGWLSFRDGGKNVPVWTIQ